MRAFLIRHASVSVECPDVETGLNDHGRLQVVKLAQVINDAEFSDVVEVWHSAFKSSRETVEILKRYKSSTLGGIELHEVDELAPDADVMNTCKLLGSCEGDVICCAQNQFLEELITAMCVGEAGVGLVDLQEAAMIRLDRVIAPTEKLPIGFWTIKWHIDPDILQLPEDKVYWDKEVEFKASD